jgi:hypothetical protein
VKISITKLLTARTRAVRRTSAFVTRNTSHSENPSVHVFSLHVERELGRLASDAGFRDVDVQRRPLRLSLPPPEQFVWQYVHSTPLSAVVAKASDANRAALEREVIAGWEPYVRDGRLVCEVDALVATARK